MIGLYPDQETAPDTVFRDAMMLALMGFVIISLILLLNFHPEAKESTLEPPGNVIVEITWPPDLNSDVDLWVRAPGDVPVGYSNKGSKWFNLLRDDLGRDQDPSGINYEVSYSRGIAAGEYVVNLHLYRNLARVAEIPVRVLVSVKRESSVAAQQLVVADAVLRKQGEEITVLRFRLSAEGSLIPGSVHSRYKSLRHAGSGYQ